MPAEVAISRAVDERRYCIHPAGIGKALYPPFHGSVNLPKDVPAAKRVTVVTNGCRELLQETAEPTSLRRMGISFATTVNALCKIHFVHPALSASGPKYACDTSRKSRIGKTPLANTSWMIAFAWVSVSSCPLRTSISVVKRPKCS